MKKIILLVLFILLLYSTISEAMFFRGSRYHRIQIIRPVSISISV